MQSLHLYIEHSLGVDLDAKSGRNIVSQPLFVRLLDDGPLLLELGIIGVFQKSLEFLEILKPLLLWDLESLGNKVGETRVTLIEPAAGSYWDYNLGAEIPRSTKCSLPLVTFPNLLIP